METLQETISPEEYRRFIELAPTNLLQQLGGGLAIALEQLSLELPENSPEFEMFGAMLSMLMRELQLREVEPLRRKAKRFAVRNSDAIKQAGAIAACIGVGVGVGVIMGGAGLAALGATLSGNRRITG
ncbi:MAG TPA: hypothetical protein VJJ98_02175 [Sedimentisphaerales bacterium]|nr:hypothetical protein [Sedimentisphaerales bacterium]